MSKEWVISLFFLSFFILLLALSSCTGKCVATGTCGNYDQSNVDFMLNDEPGWWNGDRQRICEQYQTLASNVDCMIEWRVGDK